MPAPCKWHGNMWLGGKCRKAPGYFRSVRRVRAASAPAKPARKFVGRLLTTLPSSAFKMAKGATFAVTASLVVVSISLALTSSSNPNLKDRFAALVRHPAPSSILAPRVNKNPAANTLDNTTQVLVSQQVAGNWSGYALAGTRFTTVTGTFTVPTLSATAACGENVSEWVGLDGYDDHRLIQAGVLEARANPYTGSCASGATWVLPWTEVLPSSPTAVAGLAVNPSDSVTVSIAQHATASWEITLTDNTTGRTYSTFQAYDGPTRSAEWIVEAPGTGSSGTLAPYAPAVDFQDLSVAQGNVVTAAARISMEQDGQLRSSPSPVSNLAELMTKGFGVAYS